MFGVNVSIEHRLNAMPVAGLREIAIFHLDLKVPDVRSYSRGRQGHWDCREPLAAIP